MVSCQEEDRCSYAAYIDLFGDESNNKYTEIVITRGCIDYNDRVSLPNIACDKVTYHLHKGRNSDS